MKEAIYTRHNFAIAHADYCHSLRITGCALPEFATREPLFVSDQTCRLPDELVLLLRFSQMTIKIQVHCILLLFQSDPRSKEQRIAIQSLRSQTAKPFDYFSFLPNDSTKPCESVVSRVASMPTRSESEKEQWVKPQGALSLSIFWEEEEENEENESNSSEPPQTFNHKRVYSTKHRLKVDPIVGINDILSNLYIQNQQIKDENGSPAVSYR
ncbi:hypothetical protein AAG906_010704 [Vitis piasezkii]